MPAPFGPPGLAALTDGSLLVSDGDLPGHANPAPSGAV